MKPLFFRLREKKRPFRVLCLWKRITKNDSHLQKVLTMATLVTLAEETAKRGHRRLQAEYPEPSDLAAELMRYIWEAELPDALCDPLRNLIRRGLDTIQKRYCRRQCRVQTNNALLEQHDRGGASPSEQIASRELLQQAVSDDFDAAALAADLEGQFAKFAAKNSFCSCGEAYKRRAAYRERVYSLAEAAER